MPVTPTYPGVYIEEQPSGVHTIVGAGTAEAAFVDYFTRGPVNEAVRITSFSDFERQFGGLNRRSEASYAIQQFFLNGGALAWVVRVASGGQEASLDLEFAEVPAIDMLAVDKHQDATGPTWIRLAITPPTDGKPDEFDLIVGKKASNANVAQFDQSKIEHFKNLSMTPGAANYAPTVVNSGGSGQAASKLITLKTSTATPVSTTPKLQSTAEKVYHISELEAVQPDQTEHFVDLPIESQLPITLKSEHQPAQNAINISALNPGAWGNALQVGIDHERVTSDDQFNLVVREVALVGSRRQVVNSEVYRNLSIDEASPTYAPEIVNDASTLITLTVKSHDHRPTATAANVTSPQAIARVDGDFPNDGGSGAFRSLQDGNDGLRPPGNGLPADGDWNGSHIRDSLQALYRTSFTILCLPAATALDYATPNNKAFDIAQAIIPTALKTCVDNRAFLILDPFKGTNLTQLNTVDRLTTYRGHLGATSNVDHAALYFPRVTVPDPLNSNRPRDMGASGALAGLYARTDAERGVWKAPAGTDATLAGVTLTTNLTDQQNGALNPQGINALRTFPVFGNIVWGARTLDGADRKGSDFKYVPVRRLTSYIETSLYNGTQWAVFEPNDETLWAQLRLSIGTFMADLNKQGAFYRYIVTCDESTTTPSDIERGVVNVIVAFAPVKPAEFVVLQIQQLAGQTGG